MLRFEEIQSIIDMIERVYSCEVCIWDGAGKGNLLTQFLPLLKTAHLNAFCSFVKSRLPSRTHFHCRYFDSPEMLLHKKVTGRTFVKVCQFNVMEVVTTVHHQGKLLSPISAGPFLPLKELPSNCVTADKLTPLKYKGTIHEITPGELRELTALMSMLSEEIERILAETCGPEVSPTDPRSVTERFINGKFRSDITLDMLAEKLGWSPAHTTVRLRKMFGKTFVRILTERRLLNAKQLMAADCYSLSFIAKVSGFRSETWFNRVFHKYCGESPSDYRRRICKL